MTDIDQDKKDFTVAGEAQNEAIVRAFNRTYKEITGDWMPDRVEREVRDALRWRFI